MPNKPTIPTLTTDRLTLRAFSLDDLEAYAAMYADPRFVRFLGGAPLSSAEVWENIAVILGHWHLLGYGLWAVESSETGELVGRAGLLNLPGWPDVEVCWALGPRFWGRGYATEAAAAAVRWAFDEARIPRLVSLIHPDNKASEAVALRLGERLHGSITFKGRRIRVFEILDPSRAAGHSISAEESP
ncbi:MAG: GNAT family N-acetyltransferase [Acidobacteriota bacterium]